ncbi:MAG TPA: cation-translocating P-type ATPase [Burkholderiaceae bacterium]|nr:cation-translocating P-type ATPase [Burkholderiaceae bacterium]
MPAVRELALVIDGVVCGACTVVIEDALKLQTGVRSVQVNPMTRQALIEFDPLLISADAIATEIRRLGYAPRPADAPSQEQVRRAQRKALLWRTGIAWLAMMQIMMYAWPAYQTAPGELLADHAFLLRWAQWILSLPVVLVSASPILRSAWAGMKLRKLNMDVTVSAAIVLTFVFSTHATFSGRGEVWFDSLSMFVALVLSVRYLLMRSQHLQEARIERLAAAVAGTAHRIIEDDRESLAELHIEKVDVDALRVGDLVLVPAGAVVPGDGHVVSGTSSLNEAILTGESLPVTRRPGDRVHCGAVNLSAELRVRVDALGAATRAAEIAQMIQRVGAARLAASDRADRWAPYFLAGILACSVLGAALWMPQDPDRAISVAIAVLMVTCPCALSLATPAAMLAAVSRLAQLGVYLRRPAALAKLAQITTVVFDKTGTLSADALQVEQVFLAPGRAFTEEEALRIATALEGQGFHPIAAALRQRPNAQADLPEVTEQRERAGMGVEGLIDGRRYQFGRPHSGDILPGGGVHCELSDETGRIALVAFSERIRDEARPTVQALCRQGMDLVVLSGDSPSQAARLARMLGIEGTRGGLSAEDKLAALHALQRQRKVVLAVGDGLNDGPLLAGADASAALVTGAPSTQAAADLVILGGRLSSIAALRDVARRTLAIVNQNLAWALAYNLVCVPLAVLGWISPGWASVGMAASSMAVLANAARVTRGGREVIVKRAT